MACVCFDKSLQHSIFSAGNDFEVLLNINAYYEWIIKTMTNKFDDELLLYNSNSWMTIKNWNPDPCRDSFGFIG